MKNLLAEASLERKCIENADGIVCKDLQIQHAKRHLGYRLPKIIFLVDGCWGHALSPVRHDAAEEVHVASCGDISPATMSRGDSLGGMGWLIDAFSKAGIHFEVFLPSYTRDGNNGDLARQLAHAQQVNAFLHFHDTLPLGDLEDSLSRYTFGLVVAGATMHLPDDHPVFVRRHADTVLARRLFSYLDAGIPTITHDGRLQAWLCKRYGVGFVADPGMILAPADWLRKRLPGPDFHRRISMAQESLSIDNLSRRLVRFYETL